MTETIPELMERASVALVDMDYLQCEALCLKALALARAAADWAAYARIVLPLQEARRQRRMIALDGRVGVWVDGLDGGGGVGAAGVCGGGGACAGCVDSRGGVGRSGVCRGALRFPKRGRRRRWAGLMCRAR